MIVIQCLVKIVEFVLMVTTLTPVLVLLDSLEHIVKQVITNKSDLFSKMFRSILFTIIAVQE